MKYKNIILLCLIIFSCKKENNYELEIQNKIKAKYNISEYYHRKYTPVSFSKFDTISNDKKLTKGIVYHTYKSTESYNGTILKDYTDKFNIEIYDGGLVIVKKILNEKDIYNENLEKLKTESSRLKGGGQIKHVELKDKRAVIEYVKNYKEYKKIQPQSSLTKSDIDNYWNTANALEKVLVDAPVRLMKKVDYIDEVKLIVYRRSKRYTSTVNKKELEKFIGKSFDVIKISWNHNFIDPYVYTEKGRDKFISKFVKVENH